MIKELSKLSTKWKDLVDNSACYLCDEIHHSPFLVCPSCLDDFPHHPTSLLRSGPNACHLEVCRQCALPLQTAPVNRLCRECLLQPPAFSQIQVPWLYAFPVDAMIGRFKYRHQGYFGRALSLLLAEHLRRLLDASSDQRPDFLLHVPVGRRKLWRRGFDQTHVIASMLATQLQIPFRTGVVLRQRESSVQARLNKQARQNNLHGAFRIDGSVAGARIALVDDVVTTTSTVREISHQLIVAGAQEVQVWALARTPKADA